MINSTNTILLRSFESDIALRKSVVFVEKVQGELGSVGAL